MRAIAVAAALVCLPIGIALAAQAQEPEKTLGIRLLQEGESRHVVQTLPPGERLHRRVEVLNDSPDPMKVTLYAAAASEGLQGFDFAEGRTSNELSRWTSVRPALLQVPAGGSAVAQIEVHVPVGAQEGRRYAVVWAEQVTGKRGGIALVSRVGVRLYITVRKESFPVTSVVAAALLLTTAAVAYAAARRGRRAFSRSGNTS